MTIKLKDFAEKYGNHEVNEQELKDCLGIKYNRVWKPKMNEDYFCIDISGKVLNLLWENEELDNDLWNTGNVYQTEEQAEFALNKQIFLTKMERDFEENSEPIDWNDFENTKYGLCHFVKDRNISIQHLSVSNYGILVTTNLEWLEQYIIDNEKDIKKYYFEVRE